MWLLCKSIFSIFAILIFPNILYEISWDYTYNPTCLRSSAQPPSHTILFHHQSHNLRYPIECWRCWLIRTYTWIPVKVSQLDVFPLMKVVIYMVIVHLRIFIHLIFHNQLKYWFLILYRCAWENFVRTTLFSISTIDILMSINKYFSYQANILLLFHLFF